MGERVEIDLGGGGAPSGPAGGDLAGTYPNPTVPLAPSQDEKDALTGTDGTPSSINRYVTDSDPRIGDPTSQLTTVGGTTTTTASAYDFAGGATIMSGMTLSAVPAGDYLLYFNTSVSHSAANDVISATIEVDGSQITNAEVDWRRGGSQGDIIAQLCFVGFPITLGSTQDINIHWIEVTGGTATARERSLSIIKVA